MIMKNFAYCFYIIFGSFILLTGCDNRPERTKLAHETMYKSLTILGTRHQMRFIGWCVAADTNYYNDLGLDFEIFRPLSKDEGRKILIDSVEEFLQEINANSKLQPFLKVFPFTPANVEIRIFTNQPNGSNVYFPDILVFAARRGKLEYKTKIPEKKFGYYTEEEETFEEALNIVHSQEAMKGHS